MIGGAKIGEKILIELTTNRVRHAILREVKTYGIEVELLTLKKGLTFFPFSNIVSISGEFQESTEMG